MFRQHSNVFQRIALLGILAGAVGAFPIFAQNAPDSSPPPDSESAQAQSPAPPAEDADAAQAQNPTPSAPAPAAEPTPPATPGWHRFSTRPTPPPASAPAPAAKLAPRRVPDQVTIPAGAFVTVRVDQLLSSDKSKAGDGFSASLYKPLVAGGLVVSRPGQTLGGRVVDAKKAGRVKGVSHLQIVLNTMTLADGTQVPIKTELTNISGPTSNARDAGGIMATTATGAAIGAAADWGVGAAIGAGAGLVAGTVGVLVTRGHPTIIYPESRLTFRLAAPVTITTGRAPQAFADASTLKYQREQPGPRRGYRGCAGPGCAPPPPPYYYGPGPYYPYWGPGFGVYFGHRFYR